MARGRWGSTETPSALGKPHVDAAMGKIHQACQKKVALLTSYSTGMMDTVRMLFPEETIQKVIAVREMVESKYNFETYPVEQGVQLGINYDELQLPSIQAAVMRIQNDKYGPLHEWIASVREIYEEFELLRRTLTYMDRNATPGAIRHYWPTAMNLCPDSPAMKGMEETPARYKEPKDVSVMLKALRATATTWAGSLLMPHDAKVRDNGVLWLTFNPSQITRCGVTFETDSQTFFSQK